MNASTPITEATGSSISGTYIPEQFFNDPSAYIDGTDPNGTWGLLFLGASVVIQLVLQSWSLTITTPDPIAVTNGSGNYSFTGLASGTYEVGLVPAPGDVQTYPAAGAEQTVTVTDGQNATGVDFGLQPASNLTTTSFFLSTQATTWGQAITINYTIANEGYGDAPAFDVGVFLSDDGTIAASDPSIATLHFDGLAARVLDHRPGDRGPPLDAAGRLRLDLADDRRLPDRSQPRSDAQRCGRRRQSGARHRRGGAIVAPNQAVTTAPGIQQNPSIAVDPSNPNHIVVASMDYSLVNTGYAGIGVAVSEDDGATWTDSSVPLPGGFNQGAAQPTVEFDGQGNVFIAFMAATYLGPQQPPLTLPDRASPSRWTTASRRTMGSSCPGAPTAASPGASPSPWSRIPSRARRARGHHGRQVNFELIPVSPSTPTRACPTASPTPITTTST